MAFDSDIVSFTTKTDKVDLVQAAHMNAVQNELITIETILGAGIKGTCADLKTRLAVCLAENGTLQKSANLPCSAVEGQLHYRTSDDSIHVYDGSAWDVIGPKVPAGYTNMQVFTSSGTWTKPAGLTAVFVKVVGGGGDGAYRGGGGGAGGYSEGIISVSGDVTVTVGSAGETSSFAGSSTIQATGGSDGSTGLGGGAGGLGSGGSLNLGGSPGSWYHAEGLGGDGGDSVFGGHGSGGGNEGGPTGPTSGRDNTGSGGGGSSANGGGGAAGASGVVIVYWNQ